MKNILIVFFLIIGINSYAQMGGNNPRVFNVKTFGAKGNGVTDDTRSIQAAVNACNAAGGGEVFIPNGIYIIGDTLQTNIGGLNMNSQIYIPTKNYTDALRTHITIKGETAPNFTQFSPLSTFPTTTTGAILKSTLTTGATGAAVIGTKGNAQAWGSYNYTYLSVENIMVTVKNNPTGSGPVVGGISYKNGASLLTNNVVVTVDTTANASTLPYNDISGIETTDQSSETMNNLQKTIACGFKSGFKLGEHNVLNQIQSLSCYYGFNFKTGGHASIATRLGSFWCAYDIYVSATNTISITISQIDIEWRQASKWFDNIATIKDSSNVATGSVFYTIIPAGSGVDNTKFSKSGGSNLNTYTTAAKIITGGQTSDMSLDGGNLYYSATNDNLGIGTAGAAQSAYTLELKKANPYFALNTTTTRQAAIVYQANGTNKWQFGMDWGNNGGNNFYIYDQAATKVKQYISGGDVYLGGTATAASTATMRVTDGGNVAIGNVTPTARLHLPPETATASSEPIRFTVPAAQTSVPVSQAFGPSTTGDKLTYVIATGAARKEITMNDAALTSGKVPVATTNGRLTDGLTIASGTYTPTLTNVTNVTASTAYECQYLRVGNTVTVSGKVDIDVTLGAASELGMSLPVASALTAEENAGGTASSAAAASLVSAIRADAANDRVAFVFIAVSLTNDSYFFEFTYQIK